MLEFKHVLLSKTFSLHKGVVREPYHVLTSLTEVVFSVAFTLPDI